MINRTAPACHELEVSVFGRGYGEAILLHLGDGHWALIDSVCDKDGSVSPLRYLEEIGVDPATAIDLILITHWHDDHVKGIAAVYERAVNATLAMPAVMNTTELEAFRKRVRGAGSEHLSSGVSQLDKIAIIRDQNNRSPIRAASANRNLLRYNQNDLSHQQAISIEALSPSDSDVQNFLQQVTYAQPPGPAHRCLPFEHNHISVALWVSAGPHRILLGADLETTSNPLTGWQAVLSSPSRLEGQADLVKVSHHGSENGHYQPIWDTLLTPQPTAALTTWDLSTKLPSANDVNRIINLTPSAYITSRIERKTQQQRAPSVKKTLAERSKFGVKLCSRLPTAGHIRLRLDLISASPTWNVALFNQALHLSELAA